MNIHFYMALDGVYAPGLDDKPEFFPLRPEDGEVARLVAMLADRIPALLKRRGLDLRAPEQSDPLSRDEPWLAGLYAASVVRSPGAGLKP